MSDELVTVEYGPNNTDNAVLLLAAAEDLGLGSKAVKTTEGAFLVPQAVYNKAFGDQDDQPTPAKKAASKRAASKKK